MVTILDFPPDLRPKTILRHFHDLSRTCYDTKDYDTITTAIQAAKATIKIKDLWEEVHGWGEPTLTTWNTSEARRQEVLKVHDALDDLGLDQLHTTVHILVTGGTKTPLKIIGPMVNALTHTVLESLPMLARLRMKLWQWGDCLERAEERRIADREKRKVMEERAQAARQPLVYKQFKRVISNFGGSSRGPATPAARSRPLSTISNATPPSTPPGSRPSTADPSAADKGAKETFHVESGVKISWIPFHEADPRYHDNAFVEIHRDGRRPRTIYVSLVSKGDGEEKRTSIHVRVGGGWMEFEGWLSGFLEHGRA